MLLLSYSTLLRGDDIRNARLSEMFIRVMDKDQVEGDRCVAFGIIKDNGKTNKVISNHSTSVVATVLSHQYLMGYDMSCAF
jgi:hypothetical protein